MKTSSFKVLSAQQRARQVESRNAAQMVMRDIRDLAHNCSRKVRSAVYMSKAEQLVESTCSQYCLEYLANELSELRLTAAMNTELLVAKTSGYPKAYGVNRHMRFAQHLNLITSTISECEAVALAEDLDWEVSQIIDLYRPMIVLPKGRGKSGPRKWRKC